MNHRDILEAEIAQLEKQYDDALNRSAAYVGSGEDGFTDADTEQAAIERDRIGKALKGMRAELKQLGPEKTSEPGKPR